MTLPRPTLRLRLVLLLGSVALLSLAFAPFEQFYLAWVGFVPWLFLIRGTRSLRSALIWGWLTGVVFFAANVWWLYKATIPGSLALFAYLPLDWAAAGALVYALRLLEPDAWTLRARRSGGSALHHERTTGMPGIRIAAAVLLIAMTWTGAEWLRLWFNNTFAWMPLGNSQTPVLVMCQIADALGVSGITFWVVLINAWVMMGVVHRRQPRRLIPATVIVALLLAGVLGYGWFRMSQTTPADGPVVMVVQSNDAHLRGGAATATREEKVAYHLSATRKALENTRADLVVWSETVAPPLNQEARRELQQAETGRFMEATHQALSRLTSQARVALVTGGFHVGGWVQSGKARVATEIRSSAYLYDCSGEQSPDRYDKIELVLYSERMPFASAPSWLHRLLLRVAASAAAQPLKPGTLDALTVFKLKTCQNPEADSVAPSRTYRFVAPICLENIHPRLISRMIVGEDGAKRADFLANLSNDGWFNDIERAQHLQAIRMRSIENRVPAARSSNTGISGFVDSCGRIDARLPARTAGTLTHRLGINPRVTWYARHGDVFGTGCLIAGLVLAAVRIIQRIASRRGNQADVLLK